MVHRLSAVVTGVYYQPETLVRMFFSQSRGCLEEAAKQKAVCHSRDVANVLFRYDEYVRRRLRIDIANRYVFAVFFYYFACDLLSDDFAKDAIGISFHILSTRIFKVSV